MLLRLLAFAIDVLVLFFFMCLLSIAIVTGYSLSSGSFFAHQTSLLAFFFVCGSLLMFIFYFTYLTMDGGATIGKRFFQLKVLRQDGSNLSVYRAFLRSVFYPLSLAFWFISLIIALLFNGRMIHDIIAGTQVVASRGNDE